MSNPSKHIDFATIADLAENRATASLRAESMLHIANCSDCAEKFQNLEHVVRLMQTDRTTDAPRDIVAYAMGIFSDRAKSPRQSLKRRILAALTFDSHANQVPAFGVRSGQSGARQLIYSAEEQDIDIRTTLHGDMWIVSGQVLREECTGGRVELKGVNGSATAAINELCEFTLPEVPSGDYFLRIHMADVEVEVPELELTVQV
jgi:hypothetical protein